MRSDEGLSRDFRDTSQWVRDPDTGRDRPEFERLNLYGTEYHRHSYSGHERNRLFYNLGGTRFVDLSVLSGADDIADSRTWVRWDFNGDGWNDIAVVNANKPLLSIYRNDISALAPDNGFIALRFEGGNRQAQPSRDFSPRDGFGSVVRIQSADGTVLRREHRCGEGYAAGNSATMLIGIGRRADTSTLTVLWPSGRTQTLENVRAGSLVTAWEDPRQAADGKPFTISDYQRPADGNR